MFDLNIELQYLEPQSQDKPKAMLFIEPAYSLFDKNCYFLQVVNAEAIYGRMICTYTTLKIGNN